MSQYLLIDQSGWWNRVYSPHSLRDAQVLVKGANGQYLLFKAQDNQIVQISANGRLVTGLAQATERA